MKPTLEQIKYSIEQTEPTLSSKSKDELGTIWVLTKLNIDRQRTNSPEHNLLTKFKRKVEKAMKHAQH